MLQNSRLSKFAVKKRVHLQPSTNFWDPKGTQWHWSTSSQADMWCGSTPSSLLHSWHFLLLCSRVSNKHAAQLINFLKIFHLQGLITFCMFINFWNSSIFHDSFTTHFWVPNRQSDPNDCTGLQNPLKSISIQTQISVQGCKTELTVHCNLPISYFL